ncbi:MAG TPA: DNA methyltransferase, partial [Ktedonobacteraceae bacterium]|nr:DNA methyltransferase [Ktedonobacteraceae bacterium]
FDAYQWVLHKQTAQEHSALSPDILTAIFEQHLNQKQMGAYYTQADISSYIARNTIIPYLFATVSHPESFHSAAPIWHQLQTHPDRYIPASLRSIEYLPEETAREYQARRTRYAYLHSLLRDGAICTIDDLITYNLDLQRFAQDVIETCERLDVLLAFYHTLEQLTILDPTCGSGAFLFAALNTLAPLYTICLDRMNAITAFDADTPHSSAVRAILDRVTQHPNHNHFILTSIISNNLYGVDLMEEAIEMCKLRLFLALLAHTQCLEDVRASSTINFNIRVGNALVGFIHAREVDTSSTLPPQHTLTTHQTDHYLAAQYGIEQHRFLNADGYKKAFAHWKRTHQPFHWFEAFHNITQRGGFDIIIGNPPYIEYSKIRNNYTVHGYENVGCGNLYAAVIERSLALCRSGRSYLGLIVPLSICGGERFEQLRRTLSSSTQHLWLANFEIFPCRLFDGAFQRLSLLIARHGSGESCAIHVTKIQRWYASERPHLLDLITYTLTQHTTKSHVFPKLAAPLQEIILHKVLEKSRGASIAILLTPQKTEHSVYYQEATNYWMKAVCRVPFYKKNGIMMQPPHGRFLFLRDKTTAHAIMALMNSSLFYLWFATYSDGFHLSHALVKAFPAGENLTAVPELASLSLQLEEDIKAHTQLTTRNTKPDSQRNKQGLLIELEEYHMARSKSLLDEIDRVLAKYYGFTNQELDFIINYDIKYRMGKS